MKVLLQSNKYQFRVKYYADDSGHIWSSVKKDFLSEQEDKDGYLKVTLMTADQPPGKGHRFSIHRLILESFSGIHDSTLTVDHIDGNKQNNSLENLRWTSIKENLENPNTKHKRRCYHQDGSANLNAKFSQKRLEDLVSDINSGFFKQKQILDKYEICRETLRNIIQKKTYQTDLKDIEILPKFQLDMARDNIGDKNGRSKLSKKQVEEIRKILDSSLDYISYKELAMKYNVSVSTIYRIKNNKRKI